MAELQGQDSQLIYALDIGTRGVVGIVGTMVNERLCVQEMEIMEHSKRTMVDGQIDDIRQVSKLVATLTQRLSQRIGIQLERVYLAAAGRALKTAKGTFSLELEQNGAITSEKISQLETGAVSDAEQNLQKDDAVQQFFLVGYTAVQYLLDGYPLTTLLNHSGKQIQADVVATFLPAEVVESLYTATQMAGLQVAGVTLEPIAAMNAAIPAELRLLNLALVDIGAGTTDIAVCRDGSVVGYTMATVAGDEVTEAVMRRFLVDFQTAENMKRSLSAGQDIAYVDILGMENSCTCQEFQEVIQPSAELLADKIAEQILLLNTEPPSAVFLAGGGSKLEGLQELVAQRLKMDSRRVAVAGSNYGKSAYSETMDLKTPELATPLGIAISACLGLINDNYVIRLNGKPAKLFRSGMLTIRDVLLMNGYTYGNMLARSGRSLRITVDGRPVTLHGGVGIPAVLLCNGQDASPTQVVNAGDEITFTPAVSGKDAAATVGSLYHDGVSRSFRVNDQDAAPEQLLQQGDVVVSAICKVETPQPRVPITVELNGQSLTLPGKSDGMPYYLMDLLERTQIDFEHIDCAVRMEINGSAGEFSQQLKNGDRVVICCDR